jgi:hypothetical protein
MNFLAGASLGLLVGAMLGLSASPIVASVVAALLAVVTTFFGLGGTMSGMSAQVSTERVMAFSLAMLLASIGGIYMRTHGMLSPTPSERVAAWTAAKYPVERARELAAFETLGLLPAGSETKGDTPNGSTVFFSNGSSGDCSALKADRFTNPADRLQALINSGAPWSALNPQMLPDDPVRLSAMLDGAWMVACRAPAEP